MQLQQLKRLASAIEALSSCVEVDALLTTLLAQARSLCRTEAAWIWLMQEGDQLHLHHAEGVPSTVAPHLQRMKMPAGGARVIARRLRRLGYRSVLVAPLPARTKILGMLAAGSRRSRRLRRVDGEVHKMLAQYAGTLLDMPPGHSPFVSGEAPPREGMLMNLGVQREYLHLLNTLISRITHGLNNAMATINGRVALLLNRPYDQNTVQHLGATLRSITEANQLIRHIQNLVSAQHGQGAVMFDLNQLVLDSLQIARSTWFLEFRETRVPIELTADLSPIPALLGRAPDLRIALLCILRHTMDTLRPGGRLVMRTWTEGKDPRQTVVISISDDTGHPPQIAQPPIAWQEEGIGLLLRGAQMAESRRALEFVETIVQDLGGRVTVHRNAAGGITITLRFSTAGAASYEP